MNDGNSGPVDYGDMIDDQWWSMMEKVRPPFLNLKNMKMVATSNFWGRSSSRGMPLVDGHLFKKIKTCLVCSKKNFLVKYHIYFHISHMKRGCMWLLELEDSAKFSFLQPCLRFSALDATQVSHKCHPWGPCPPLARRHRSVPASHWRSMVRDIKQNQQVQKSWSVDPLVKHS